MDPWQKSLRRDQPSNTRKNPSFSSTLLDAIYRSIDEHQDAKEELFICKETVRKTTLKGFSQFEDREATHLRRTSPIQTSSDYDKVRRKTNPLLLNSASSSTSESSYGGFSSSEAESLSGASVLTTHRPKPIRTGKVPIPVPVPVPIPIPVRSDPPLRSKTEAFEKKLFLEHYIKRTTPKAKKQPASPGARLAGFLNSLFAATGTAKKAKLSSSFDGHDSRSEKKPKSSSQSLPTCSSACSYSRRSCLSKTKSTSANGLARSVKFHPDISVIVAGECRPRRQEEGRNLTALTSVADKKRAEEEVAISEFRKVEEMYGEFGRRNGWAEEEDDEDSASDSSSDLFELGIELYREELPVFETTRIDNNRAIANSLTV